MFRTPVLEHPASAREAADPSRISTVITPITVRRVPSPAKRVEAVTPPEPGGARPSRS